MGTAPPFWDKTDSLRHLPDILAAQTPCERGHERGTIKSDSRITIFFHNCQIFTKIQTPTLPPDDNHPPYRTPPPILRHPLGKWVRVGAVPSLLPLPQQVHLLLTYCSSPHSLCCFSPRCQGTALLVHQKPYPAKQKDIGPMLPAQKLVSIRKALTTLSGTECDLPGWADHRPEGICSSESNVNGSGLKTQLKSSINYKRVASRSILQKA